MWHTSTQIIVGEIPETIVGNVKVDLASSLSLSSSFTYEYKDLKLDFPTLLLYRFPFAGTSYKVLKICYTTKLYPQTCKESSRLPQIPFTLLAIVGMMERDNFKDNLNRFHDTLPYEVRWVICTMTCFRGEDSDTHIID